MQIFFIAAIVLVRLVNGSTEYEGRVEVYNSGEWSTVCYDKADFNYAKVVCRQLGFGPAIDFSSEAIYEQGSNQICFINSSCTGEETALHECSYYELESRSHYSKDAVVKCAAPNGISMYAHDYVHTYICIYVYNICVAMYIVMYICTYICKSVCISYKNTLV